MRTRILLVAVALWGCGAGPSTPGPLAEVALTPHREATTVGPIGAGTERCAAHLYEWNGAGCRFQLNHCALEREGSDSVVCLSLADERTLACGEADDACGQTVRCVCPDGPAPAVAEEPATWHVRPDAIGERTASADGRCTATVTTIPGGPPPAPCIFDVRECDASGACIDRQQMMSCGVRSTICDRPMRCDCMGEITEAARAAACSAPCADARTRVRVYRTPDGEVARLATEPPPGGCSHPPITIFDASGATVGALGERPVAAGSPEQAEAMRRRTELLMGLESEETFSCAP